MSVTHPPPRNSHVSFLGILQHPDLFLLLPPLSLSRLIPFGPPRISSQPFRALSLSSSSFSLPPFSLLPARTVHARPSEFMINISHCCWPPPFFRLYKEEADLRAARPLYPFIFVCSMHARALLSPFSLFVRFCLSYVRPGSRK